MAKIETLWEQRKPFGQAGLEFWGFADGTDDASTIYDISPHADDLIVDSTPPILQSNIVNGLQSIYFNGSKNPLKFTRDFTLKHAFLVIATEGATFSANRGWLSDLTANGILTGVSGTDKFQNFGYGADFVYRKSDLEFVNTNLKAPVSSGFAIIELLFPNGLDVGGLQLGQDREDAAKKAKGWFNELIAFSLRKGWNSRMNIYGYLAEKYHLWRELADGTKIFPFFNNHASPFAPLRYKIQSAPLPNGIIKTRIKGSKLQNFEFNLGTRHQDTIDAIEAFETSYFDGRVIAVENNSFYPPRRHKIIPTSDVSVDPQSLNLFDCKWNGRQADTTAIPVVIDFDELPEPAEPPLELMGLYDEPDGLGLLDEDGFGLLG